MKNDIPSPKRWRASLTLRDSNSPTNMGNFLVNDTIDKDSGAILRLRNGYLDGGNLPAVECDDSHMEFYKDGQLHREDGPAVVSNYGKVKEFWKNGRRQS